MPSRCITQRKWREPMNDDSLLFLCVSRCLPTTAKWRQLIEVLVVLIILWFDRNSNTTYKSRMMRIDFLQYDFKVIYNWKTHWAREESVQHSPPEQLHCSSSNIIPVPELCWMDEHHILLKPFPSCFYDGGGEQHIDAECLLSPVWKHLDLFFVFTHLSKLLF